MKFDVFGAIETLREYCGTDASLTITKCEITGSTGIKASSWVNGKYIKQSMWVSKEFVAIGADHQAKDMLNAEFKLLVEGLSRKIERERK